MIIFCGTGPVRAGQWARSLCVNDGLSTGSMIPYFEKAVEEGYSILVLNPNKNSVVQIENSTRQLRRKNKSSKSIPIKGSETPFGHVNYVWDNFIRKSPAKNIVIVAHSFGGVLASTLLHDKEQEIFGPDKIAKKLRAIAFTDSVHSSNPRWSARIKAFMKTNCKNWAKSDKPLNKELKSVGGCPVVSAGHTTHEYTSAFCMEPLFEFLKEKVSNEEEEQSNSETEDDQVGKTGTKK